MIQRYRFSNRDKQIQRHKGSPSQGVFGPFFVRIKGVSDHIEPIFMHAEKTQTFSLNVRKTGKGGSDGWRYGFYLGFYLGFPIAIPFAHYVAERNAIFTAIFSRFVAHLPLPLVPNLRLKVLFLAHQQCEIFGRNKGLTFP